jgi:hypothetical protein
MTETSAPPASNRLPSLRRKTNWVVLAYAAVFALTLAAAYWALFSQFAPYDDEGFFEHGFRLFAQGHALYNNYYTQYGPFPYELWGWLFRIAGRTLTTDTGRLIQVGIWCTASLSLGFLAHRLTRQLGIGIAVQALSFQALGVMLNEPMHPGGLIALMLILAVCIVVFGFDRWPARSLIALGGLLACVALTKINLGGYAFIALVYASVMAHPSLRRRAWARRTVSLGIVALGPLIMYGQLDDDWALRYAALAAGGALALCIAVEGIEHAAADDWLSEVSARRFLGCWIGGAFAVAIVILALVIAQGSTPGEIFYDVVIRASRTGSIVTVPIMLGSRVVVWAFGGVAVAFTLARSGALKRAAEIPELVTGLSRIAVGIAIWLSLTATAPVSLLPDAALALAMPLAWVAAIPSRHGSQTAGSYFVRLFITTLALIEALDGFPVAGSQIEFGAVLFFVCGAICVADGLADIHAWSSERVARGLLRIDIRNFVSAGAAALALIFVYVEVDQPLQTFRASYEANIALAVNGASRLRLPQGQAFGIDQVVNLLVADCRSLVTLPGQFSFNDWTGLSTPSDLLLSEDAWTTMTAEESRRAVRTLRTTPGLCVLNTVGLDPQTGAVAAYVAKDFRPIGSAYFVTDTYSIEVRARSHGRTPVRRHSHARVRSHS